jgi:hypothetical protein
MANTKISALPTYTGSTPGVYVVMDDSGMTQTYKVTYETLIGKSSGLVNAGTFVTLDNLKATLTSSANRGLSIATVSGSFTANLSGTYSTTTSTIGGAAAVAVITTTASTSLFNWNFTGQADTSTYIVSDITNGKVYRVTLMIGGTYLNNFISIERLL